MLARIKRLVPRRVRSAYHFVVAMLGVLIYAHPSRRLTVIGVTGTKGKSSTIEYINAIFETAGYKTALTNSIRTKIAAHSTPNAQRSMPGRFFLQRFFARARAAGCTLAIIEMTSEGALQHRHRGISLDAFVFLNLAPEHIEAHGSLEKYADAKLALARQLARSSKRPRIMVINGEDAQAPRYLALPAEHKISFGLSEAAPYEAGSRGGSFTFHGTRIATRLPGEFSLKNALAAASLARAFGISNDYIARGIASISRIPGRAEEIDAGQPFRVVVDYAHTPDSLQALYRAYGDSRRICVLSATGGGRDRWKRPVMGKIADESCATVIITDEDPYDEDPLAIMREVAAGCAREPEIIPDRRAAIARGVSLAQRGDVVLITGKGTDAAIHGARGSTTAWSDANIARDEIEKVRKQEQL